MRGHHERCKKEAEHEVFRAPQDGKHCQFTQKAIHYEDLYIFVLYCIGAGNHKAKLVALRSVSRMSRVAQSKQTKQCMVSSGKTMPVSRSSGWPRRSSAKDAVLLRNSSKGEDRSQVAWSASIFESSGRKIRKCW